MNTVAIEQNSDIEESIKKVLGALEMDNVIRDKVVAIKPNDTWASTQNLTSVTQPESLRTVIQQIKKYNPKQIIISGGSGAAETEDVFDIGGMMDVIQEEEVEFFDHNRPPFEEIELTYEPDKDFDGPQKSVMVNPRVLEYDTLISLAQLKVHETATVTLCMKNIAMSYPAADYYGHPRGYHLNPHHFFEDMHSFIVAMVKRFPIHVGIIVGNPTMIGLGPIGGHTFNTGLAIASLDAISTDTVGARLLGFKPQGVRHLWEARNINLGETNVNTMHFPLLDVNEALSIVTSEAYGKESDLVHP